MATNSFQLVVWECLCEADKSSNVLYSPLGVLLPFPLVYSGANGSTSDELQVKFSLPENKNISVLSSSHNQLFERCGVSTLSFGGAVVIDSKLLPNSDFIRRCQKFNFMSVYTTDLTMPHNVFKYVEGWLNNVAKERSEFFNMFNRPNLESNSMSLFSCVIYKAVLSESLSFETVQMPFVQSDQRAVNVEMMQGIGCLRFWNCPARKLKFLEVPLGDKSQYCLYIILPEVSTELVNTERMLSKFNLLNDIQNMTDCVVNVTLPKMIVSATNQLRDPMRIAGFSYIFDRATSDFKEISGQPMAINPVCQKAIFLFEIGPEQIIDDSLGSIRTSIRSIGSRKSLKKVTFTACHPFLFIVGKVVPTQPDFVVLFLGRYSKSSPE